jgi:predicted MFS family arabinose efflux permease
MAALAVYARRFPPERFATLTGLQYGIGSIGSLFATVPLAWSAAAIGWRGSFVAVGGLVLLVALLIAAVLRDQADDGAPHASGTFGDAVAGIIAVARTPSVAPLFVMNLTCYSSFALFVGLWGGPYLSHIYGFGLHQRGELLLIPAVAQIVGAFAWGPMDRLFGSYKTPVLLGAGATVIALMVIGIVGVLSLPLLMLWMALFGLVSAYTVVVIAHGKALLAPTHIGRGLTLFNMATMGGVFVAQAVSGLVIDLFPATGDHSPLAAYRAVFLLQALFIVIATAIYATAHDPRRVGAGGYAKLHEGIAKRN